MYQNIHLSNVYIKKIPHSAINDILNVPHVFAISP